MSLMRTLWNKRNLVAFALIASALTLGVWWFWFRPESPPVVLVTDMQLPPSGHTLASFRLTNDGKRLIVYRFMVESKSDANWPIYPAGTALPHPAPDRQLKPSESVSLLIGVPQKGRWRVSVVYHEAETRRDRTCAVLRACYLN